jgi:ABC-2 type transport system permease protein
MSYSAKNTLPYRVELYRQFFRKRTLFAYIFVVALPVIVAGAVKFGPSGHSGGPTRLGSGSFDLIGLATVGAANFTITMFYFAIPFLLVTVIALFSGDTVASEASWSTLRYLLASPVPRTRLLIQKLKVSLTLSAIALLMLPVTSWAVGLVIFGNAPLQSPLGITIDSHQALIRIVMITAYTALALLFVSGLAFYMSIRTDAPLGAVGVAVGIVILMNILDAVTALGGVRNYLPVHFSYSWFDLLGANIIWGNMVRGACYSLIWFIVLLALAINRFRTKDIVS